VLREAVDQKHGRHHDGDETDHQPREASDAPIEGGRRLLCGDAFGELTEVRVPAGACDHADAVPADHVVAHEAEIGQLERAAHGLVRGVRELLGRHRFAGEHRLVDEQILGLDEAQVRGNHVASGNAHDVARHDLLHGNLGESFAAPAHARRGLHQRPQPRRGSARAMLLDEGRQRREDDHDGDDDRGARVAEQVRHCGERDEQGVERVPGAPAELGNEGGRALACNDVASARKTRLGLGRVESARARAELRERRLGRGCAQLAKLIGLSFPHRSHATGPSASTVD
jgi:hypothetical protein